MLRGPGKIPHVEKVLLKDIIPISLKRRENRWKQLFGWSSRLIMATHKHKELSELKKEKEIFFKDSLLRIERVFRVNRQLVGWFFFPLGKIQLSSIRNGSNVLKRVVNEKK